jgi:hypothetical protein
MLTAEIQLANVLEGVLGTNSATVLSARLGLAKGCTLHALIPFIHILPPDGHILSLGSELRFYKNL